MEYDSGIGNITLQSAVFARIVTECGKRFSSRMIFSTPKGKPVREGQTGKENLNHISVEYIEALNSVNYRVYIIVRFGISISALLEGVSDVIRKETMKVTGCGVGRIHFHVTGIKSKNLVKRNLEFIY